MPKTAYALYVGIDWGTVTHQVAVLDAQRVLLGERAIAHEATALHALTEWLTQLAAGELAHVAVALEVPRGAVVDTLLERGFHVFALNPKQLDRFRDRYTVAGAKDDRRDAFVLATALATDQPAFGALEPEDPLIIELREWSRAEDELREEWGRLASRLREQLHRFYPQALALCPAAAEGWFWALVELAPTPAAALRLRRAAVVTLLRAHRIRRLTADHVLAALLSPPLRVAPGTVQAASAHVALLILRLELVDRQRRDCARRIERLLDALATTGEHQGHRDVTILRSLPGVGRVVAATMLAEASRLLAARDYHGLRTRAGVAPVTRQSGKRLLVGMRYACNPRLRNALYYWGFISVRDDAHSRQHYQLLRGRGHSQKTMAAKAAHKNRPASKRLAFIFGCCCGLQDLGHERLGARVSSSTPACRDHPDGVTASTSPPLHPEAPARTTRPSGRDHRGGINAEIACSLAPEVHRPPACLGRGAERFANLVTADPISDRVQDLRFFPHCIRGWPRPES